MKSFSLCDSQKIPLDLKLDKIVNSKEKGFYIELGAFDGLSQSNTAFFEFYRKWSGILIEPSKKSYELCKINRPNSEIYNLCCVSNEYTANTIKGDFNGLTMSSVNGERLNSSELVDVKVSTLENILDNYFINKQLQTIDFLSIDTEGYELNILKGLNIFKYKPLFILVEIYEKDYDEIYSFLLKNGYKLHSNFSNYNICDNPGWDKTHNDYLFYIS